MGRSASPSAPVVTIAHGGRPHRTHPQGRGRGLRGIGFRLRRHSHDAPDGLNGVDKFPAVLEELARRGWSDEDLLAKVAGANVLRVMRKVEIVATELSRTPPAEPVISELDGSGANRAPLDFPRGRVRRRLCDAEGVRIATSHCSLLGIAIGRSGSKAGSRRSIQRQTVRTFSPRTIQDRGSTVDFR